MPNFDAQLADAPDAALHPAARMIALEAARAQAAGFPATHYRVLCLARTIMDHFRVLKRDGEIDALPPLLVAVNKRDTLTIALNARDVDRLAEAIDLYPDDWKHVLSMPVEEDGTAP